jgi:hypothetical protein
VANEEINYFDLNWENNDDNAEVAAGGVADLKNNKNLSYTSNLHSSMMAEHVSVNGGSINSDSDDVNGVGLERSKSMLQVQLVSKDFDNLNNLLKNSFDGTAKHYKKKSINSAE